MFLSHYEYFINWLCNWLQLFSLPLFSIIYYFRLSIDFYKLVCLLVLVYKWIYFINEQRFSLFCSVSNYGKIYFFGRKKSKFKRVLMIDFFRYWISNLELHILNLEFRSLKWSFCAFMGIPIKENIAEPLPRTVVFHSALETSKFILQLMNTYIQILLILGQIKKINIKLYRMIENVYFMFSTYLNSERGDYLYCLVMRIISTYSVLGFNLQILSGFKESIHAGRQIVMFLFTLIKVHLRNRSQIYLLP